MQVWTKVQAARKPQKNEDGEEEDPIDVSGEEFQQQLAEELYAGEPTEGPFAIKRIVSMGLYFGERTPRPEVAPGVKVDPAFDTEVTPKKGMGVTLGPEGDVYAGEYKAGKRHGRGALRAATGAVYVGGWEEGKKSGQGRMTYADGSTYDGAWKQGVRHGRGTYTHTNGDMYVGEWWANQKQGQGRYCQKAQGLMYEGTWKLGKLVSAKVTMSDGSCFFSKFEGGRPVGPSGFAMSNGAAIMGNFKGAEKAGEEEEETEEAAAPPPPSTWEGGELGAVDGMTEQRMREQYCTVKPTLNVVISGPPASGKGTAAEEIVKAYGLVHVSTGDMLRAATEDESNEDGQKAKEFMNEGQLVPDELIISIVVARLQQKDCLEKGWLLDGFPRTAVQAAEMQKHFIVPTKVVILECGDDVIVERISGRRLDPQTGKIYHLTFNAPADSEDGTAAEIMERLTQREDDTEETVRKRLAAYASNKTAVQDAFSNICMVVDANRDKGVIWEEIKTFLEQ